MQTAATPPDLLARPRGRKPHWRTPGAVTLRGHMGRLVRLSCIHQRGLAEHERDRPRESEQRPRADLKDPRLVNRAVARAHRANEQGGGHKR